MQALLLSDAATELADTRRSGSHPQQELEKIKVKTTGNTILITGGGSGIGRELARRFNALGNTIIVAGRRMSTLEETIAGRERMHAMTLDVEDPKAIETFAKEVIAQHLSLNILINNAGIMRRENLTETRDLYDAEQTITANLLGPIRLTNALTDHLASQPDAVIVNVSSGLAFVPLSATPTYNATRRQSIPIRCRCANSSRERSRSSSLRRLRFRPSSGPASRPAKATCRLMPSSTRR